MKIMNMKSSRTFTERTRQFLLHKKITTSRSANQIGQLFGSANRSAYIGWIGYDNLGDEILLQAHENLFPQLKFLPINIKGDFGSFYFKLTHSSYYKYGFLGGGTLIDNRIFWLEHIEALVSQHIPLFSFGTGVSFSEFKQDMKSDISDRWRKALQDFEFIGVRGPESKRQLEELGVKNAKVVGDTAIALAPMTQPEISTQNRVGICFGIGTSSPIEGDETKYIHEMADFINLLHAQGYETILLPVWKEDIPSNYRLMDLVKDTSCILNVEAYKSYDLYAQEVCKCKYFLGQKLHGTIIATMHRVPSIMIGYRPKCRDYMLSISMEDWLLKTEDFDHKNALRTFTKLVDQEHDVRKELDKQIRYYIKLQRDLANSLPL